MSLVPMDATSEVAVSSYLERARDWLAKAVDETGPEQIAAAKAEIATAAEATKQLGLSKEIREDAVEMVRRAEYALRKSLNKAQAEGFIASRESNLVPGNRSGRRADPTSTSASPKDFFTNSTEYEDANVMGALAPDEFDEVINEAKAEGNLSRANVTRKAREIKENSSVTREARACDIAEMAQEGYSTRQIAKKLGIHEDTVYNISRDFDVHIPADAVVKGTRRLNSNRILSGAVESLEVAAMSLQQIDPSELDPEATAECLESLFASLTTIRKSLNNIKENVR